MDIKVSTQPHMDSQFLRDSHRHETPSRVTPEYGPACARTPPSELAAALAARDKAECETTRLRGVLQQREHMLAERDDLLQLFAHEVRQPLHRASAALHAAAIALQHLGGEPDPHVGEQLQHAEQVLGHVVGTLNNIAVAATALMTQPQPCTCDVDVQALLDLVTLDLDARQRQRVSVQRQCAVRTVQLHPELVRLALGNVLNNALAYAPQSPVALRVVDTDEPLSVTFEVVDHGEGIPSELLPALLAGGRHNHQPRSVRGAGLGLYIVHQVVRLHRGTMDIAAGTPRGTRVSMTFPQGVGP